MWHILKSSIQMCLSQQNVQWKEKKGHSVETVRLTWAAVQGSFHLSILEYTSEGHFFLFILEERRQGSGLV